MKTIAVSKTRLLARIALLTACLHLLFAPAVAQDQQVPRQALQWLDSLAKAGERPQPGRPVRHFPVKPQPSHPAGTSAPAGRQLLSIPACSDTSGRFALEKAPGHFFVGNAIRSRDGNILISGEYVKFVNNDVESLGFLMKTDTSGKVIFTKLYDSLSHQAYTFLTFYDLVELQDGSVMLAGTSPDPVSGNWDFILSRTDAAGNLIWTTDLYSRIWLISGGGGSGDYFYVQQMQQDPASGDVYITGPSWAEGFYLLKVDSKTGKVAWSTTYKLDVNGYNNEMPGGLVVRQNDVLLFGSYFLYQPSLLVYRVNKQTGDTLATLHYPMLSEPKGKLGFLKPLRPQVLDNGGIAFPGTLFGMYDYTRDSLTPFYQAGVVRFDDNLEIRDGFVLRNLVQSNVGSSMVTVNRDGTGTFTMLEFGSGYSGKWVQVQFRDKQVVKERRRRFTNEGYPIENNTIQLAGGREMLVQSVGDSIRDNTFIVFSKLATTDTGSACLGLESFETFTEPLSYHHSGSAWLDSIRYDVFRVRRPRSLTASSLAMNPPFDFCRQASACNNFSLKVNRDTACPFVPLLLTARRETTCGSRIHWQYDSSGVQSFRALNDSVYEMIFRQGWEGMVHATLEGCEVLMDSVRLVVLDAPAFPDLGPDTAICAGNKIILNARKGFASYRWQDGSKDSVLTVTKPGTYFVTVTSACGATLSDTLRVLPHPPVTFSLGEDRSVCLGDSLLITPTQGFINYSWSPAYRISSLTGTVNTVWPAIDTSYMVKAGNTPGCFVYDTIRIRVMQVSEVRLGNDTSFCNGDSVLLDAGAGFAALQWNTGSTGRFQVAKSAGYYAVNATASNDCSSRDTLRVVQVYPNPQVNLGNDTVICAGSTRVLDAGAFTRYTWSTGAVSRTITINDSGYYRVAVTDANNCKAGGSLYVAKKIMVPSQFLSADTAICNYGEIVLSPLKSFAHYNWNTGAIQAALIVNAPGLYWLQVADEYNCEGRDTIKVLPKECLKGLYVPTAFSPNADGKNDRFRPLVFGAVVKIEWSIYNRFGEAVFTTNSPTAGWDGNYGGKPAVAGAYAWKCRYELAGEQGVFKSGTVMLLR